MYDEQLAKNIVKLLQRDEPITVMVVCVTMHQAAFIQMRMADELPDAKLCPQKKWIIKGESKALFVPVTAHVQGIRVDVVLLADGIYDVVDRHRFEHFFTRESDIRKARAIREELVDA